ncbi:EAL domain-containing protein [Brenneria sp. L3-3C-1]|nr:MULTISPECIES: EAL domain-containing protein [unclassified Brenneria]MBJ7221089.1 EAL domain-containing protein [Brenneria sp. L3-3C-1]NPD00255.1 EAL domain-containing protein [Brenneria sp. hezel4-2-4]
MRIRLEVDYVNDYVFWPMYSLEGRLLAVEMISRFNSLSGNLSIPPDILINMLKKSQKHDFVKEQLGFIKNSADWFTQNNTLLVLKVDHEIADFLVGSKSVCDEIKTMPFIQLEINELFPNLSRGKRDARLLKLSEWFDLWLDNFGSGKINLQPLHDGLLNTVKMDPNFVGHLLSRSANTLIMEPLLRVIKNHYQGVRIIAKGIDTPEYLNKARLLDIDAVQGNLWPAVHFDELKTQADFFS